MLSALKRLVKRIICNEHSNNRNFDGPHKRTSSTLPPPQGAAEQQATADQIQSAFFSKLPPEIRQLIYKEIFGGGRGVVHLVKKPQKPLVYVHCKGECATIYNYKCRGRESRDHFTASDKTFNSSEGRLLPLLQTCQRVYSEAIDTLYSVYTFDFRCFRAVITFSLSLPPDRWNAIQKMHLQWHFGHTLWAFQEKPGRRIYDPGWVKVWNILSYMQNLREVYVDLDAYLEEEADTLTALIEAEVFEPLMRVRAASRFVVKITWPPNQVSSTLEVPFVVDRPASRGDMVTAAQYRLEASECFGSSEY